MDLTSCSSTWLEINKRRHLTQMKVKEGVHDERERNTNMKRQIEI